MQCGSEASDKGCVWAQAPMASHAAVALQNVKTICYAVVPHPGRARPERSASSANLQGLNLHVIIILSSPERCAVTFNTHFLIGRHNPNPRVASSIPLPLIRSRDAGGRLVARFEPMRTASQPWVHRPVDSIWPEKSIAHYHAAFRIRTRV